MATVESHSAKSVSSVDVKTESSVDVKKPKKYGEVKTFSADELPNLEPNIKKTETVYSIGEESVEKCIKNITFKSDAKENMLVIFMAKCKICNLLFDSTNSNLSVKNAENKCICNYEKPEENIERKAFFMEYYNLKYLIHYIDGINFNDYNIRGCNCIYYVDEEESKVINKYLDKMENVCKFPLIRYKKMLNIFMTANYNNGRNQPKIDIVNVGFPPTPTPTATPTATPTPPTTPTEGSSSSGMSADMNEVVPVVYGGSDYIDPPVEDLNEALKDKTKRKNFIKYSNLEERREARLKQTIERLNKRELCGVCKCDVRLGGLSKHLLTTKHINNMKLSVAEGSTATASAENK